MGFSESRTIWLWCLYLCVCMLYFCWTHSQYIDARDRPCETNIWVNCGFSRTNRTHVMTVHFSWYCTRKTAIFCFYCCDWEWFVELFADVLTVKFDVFYIKVDLRWRQQMFISEKENKIIFIVVYINVNMFLVWIKKICSLKNIKKIHNEMIFCLIICEFNVEKIFCCVFILNINGSVARS